MPSQSKTPTFRQTVAKVRAYVKAHGGEMVGTPVPVGRGIWQIAVRRPDAGSRAIIVTVSHEEIERHSRQRQKARSTSSRDARRTSKAKALASFERALIQHHKGGSGRARHEGSRVPDTMQAAFDAGATEAEIHRVMDKAAQVTERHRGEQYRKSRTRRDATPNINPVCPVGTQVQTVILSQQYFNQREATSWIRRQGFRVSKIDATTNSWRFRQQNPNEFDRDSFRTIRLRPGVTAVIGCPR